MKEIYRTINDFGQDEVIINKSRFIGYASPIESEEDALDFIESIKLKHRDATHNCYAYVFGEDSNIQRFSDDGEPSGTAGIPILEVIKKEDLRNVVVVATRYFGGVKLGGGGLIRAYTRTAKIGLEAGQIVDMTLHTNLKISIPYTLFGKFENFLLTSGYKSEDIIYTENVEIIIYVMNWKLQAFIEDVMNMSNGLAEIKSLEEKHLPAIDGTRIY